MRVNVRRDLRRAARAVYSICWQDLGGLTKSIEVEGIDISDAGLGFKSFVELRPGMAVFIQGQEGHPRGYGVVRHCAACQAGFLVGIEFDEETKKTLRPSASSAVDYYELLQISPNAELATIQRVYRFLAARYHPDNAEKGDPEKFLLLQSAFSTLSDPERRAEYDLARQGAEVQTVPISESVDFMDGIQGEVNRRLALLSVLYRRRRISPQDPKVSLAEAETRMGFPRDYLDFTIWYLKSKRYITVGDNSDLALTSLGVDYVEENCSSIPILHRLLESGAASDSQAAEDPDEPDSSEQVLLASSDKDAAAAGA